jgi:VWFA-related protein
VSPISVCYNNEANDDPAGEASAYGRAAEGKAMTVKRFLQIAFILGTVLLGSAAIPGPPGAPAAQEKTQPVLRQEVNVFFKLVQVYVVDKKGNPVTDLTAADFELTDDGKAQKIEHFEVHRLEPVPAAETGRAAPAPAAPGLRRKFFFVFNYAFIEPAGILKARRAALDFLDNHVHPTDELGIITFSMSQGLKINEYLTTDHARIKAMIEGVAGRSYLGRAEQIASLYARNISQYLDTEAAAETTESRAGEDVAKEVIRDIATSEAKARLANYSQSVTIFLNSLGLLARGLRFVPGTKNLLLFSTGISGAALFGSPSMNLPENLNTVEALIQWQDGLAVKYGDSRLREFFQKVNEELRASNCPVYSFNVSGPQLTNDIEGFQSSDENVLGMKARDTVGNDSLKLMSSQTGGQYYSYTMNLKDAVRQLQKTTNTFYVLGYPIPATYDGKFHKIKIKVKRKGCDVFGEGGYYNPKPFAQYTEFEKFIHVLELAEGQTPYLQEGIDFGLAAYPVPVRDKVAVALYAPLPAERFKALGQGPAEAVAILFNARNKVTVYKKTPVYVSALTADSVFFDQAAELPPGTYDCRLVVRSLETGRGASAGTKVLIPAAAKAPGLTLYPANIFLPGDRPRYLGDVGALALLFPFNLNAVPVVEGMAKEAAKLIAILPCAAAGIAEPDLAVSFSLVKAATNETSPLEFAITNRYRGPNALTMLAEIALPALEAGPYTLVADAEDKITGATSRAATNFIVK